MSAQFIDEVKRLLDCAGFAPEGYEIVTLSDIDDGCANLKHDIAKLESEKLAIKQKIEERRLELQRKEESAKARSLSNISNIIPLLQNFFAACEQKQAAAEQEIAELRSEVERLKERNRQLEDERDSALAELSEKDEKEKEKAKPTPEPVRVKRGGWDATVNSLASTNDFTVVSTVEKRGKWPDDSVAGPSRHFRFSSTVHADPMVLKELQPHEPKDPAGPPSPSTRQVSALSSSWGSGGPPRDAQADDKLDDVEGITPPPPPPLPPKLPMQDVVLSQPESRFGGEMMDDSYEAVKRHPSQPKPAHQHNPPRLHQTIEPAIQTKAHYPRPSIPKLRLSAISPAEPRPRVSKAPSSKSLSVGKSPAVVWPSAPAKKLPKSSVTDTQARYAVPKLPLHLLPHNKPLAAKRPSGTQPIVKPKQTLSKHKF